MVENNFLLKLYKSVISDLLISYISCLFSVNLSAFGNKNTSYIFLYLAYHVKLFCINSIKNQSAIIVESEEVITTMSVLFEALWLVSVKP